MIFLEEPAVRLILFHQEEKNHNKPRNCCYTPEFIKDKNLSSSCKARKKKKVQVSHVYLYFHYWSIAQRTTKNRAEAGLFFFGNKVVDPYVVEFSMSVWGLLCCHQRVSVGGRCQLSWQRHFVVGVCGRCQLSWEWLSWWGSVWHSRFCGQWDWFLAHHGGSLCIARICQESEFV